MPTEQPARKDGVEAGFAPAAGAGDLVRALVRLTLLEAHPAIRVTARTVAPLRPGDDVAVRVIGPALAYAR